MLLFYVSREELSPVHIPPRQGSKVAVALRESQGYKKFIRIRLLESGDGIVGQGTIDGGFIVQRAGAIRGNEESVGVEVDLKLFHVLAFVSDTKGAGEEIAGDGDGGRRTRSRSRGARRSPGGRRLGACLP